MIGALAGISMRVGGNKLGIAVARLIDEIRDRHPEPLSERARGLDAAQGVATQRSPMHADSRHLAQLQLRPASVGVEHDLFHPTLLLHAGQVSLYSLRAI